MLPPGEDRTRTPAVASRPDPIRKSGTSTGISLVIGRTAVGCGETNCDGGGDGEIPVGLGGGVGDALADPD